MGFEENDARATDELTVEDIVNEANLYTDALVSIAQAEAARDAMENAYTEAFDEFSEVEQAYGKFFKTAPGPAGNLGRITDLVKKYGPLAMKYFGAGGVGAGALLALSKDGTGAGILSKITGLFGFGS